MSVILDFINKYIKRNEKSLSSKNVIHAMNGIVLGKSSDLN